ncbi:MAG: PilZ domain-containing protein [Oligoflexia bacterium]|nr:PilZ domain-containing protein [Oligoflexia bacterium]
MFNSKFKERKIRKTFGLPVIISLDDNSIELPARLNDISEGGVSFKSNALFPVDERIDIIIPYPQIVLSSERPEPLKIRVDIRWSREFTDDNDFLIRYIHGCMFVLSDDLKDLTKDVKELIKLSEQLGEKPLGF